MELDNRSNVSGFTVHFYKDSSGKVFMTRNQIGEALGYTNPQRALSNIFNRNAWVLEDLTKEVKIKSTDGKFYKTQLFSEDGIKFVVNYSRKPINRKLALLELLEISHELQEPPRKEVEYLHSLQKIFRMYDTEREKLVGEYRIDLAFKDIKLAVECDEFGHTGYNKDKELRRENFIKSKGFQIYRFNPDEEHFCFDTVVGDILEIILTTTTSLK